MYKHFIAIASLYTKGFRIAWHYSEDNFETATVQKFLSQLKKKHGDIKLGVHKIVTDSPEWESVVESDSYFAGIIVTHNKEEFIDLITAEQKLGAIDIAKYILTVSPMSPLKLQKLLYLSYEKFLIKTGEQLFKDPIYAWKHGPVVETVYDFFREYGSQQIPYEEDDSIIINSSDLSVSPSFMRVLTSEHGATTINVIHDVLMKYCDLTAWQLVDLTHEEGKPWFQVYKPGSNKVITDEVILAYAQD
ncbi:Panacea domain-containing protein [Planomicrobium sp. MB-3u-38]|uniref:Panacea domain-containing protein n=1 Tax=Planomicrobium sp. MB-3u-38 TaxID=2058318 RepID=UPI000C7B0198|nr:type II toxin-antitoxin system antitoxin SocA domain-containing protein [Planomicrobium sp. MB-3u-38]PKH09875.1 hypothetical protein CXF70_11735 [Planomicrobium sp. MB-3u-38]